MFLLLCCCLIPEEASTTIDAMTDSYHSALSIDHCCCHEMFNHNLHPFRFIFFLSAIPKIPNKSSFAICELVWHHWRHSKLILFVNPCPAAICILVSRSLQWDKASQLGNCKNGDSTWALNAGFSLGLGSLQVDEQWLKSTGNVEICEGF